MALPATNNNFIPEGLSPHKNSGIAELCGQNNIPYLVPIMQLLYKALLDSNVNVLTGLGGGGGAGPIAHTNRGTLLEFLSENTINIGGGINAGAGAINIFGMDLDMTYNNVGAGVNGILPAIVNNDAHAYIAIGAPGGNWYNYNVTLVDAVGGPQCNTFNGAVNGAIPNLANGLYPLGVAGAAQANYVPTVKGYITLMSHITQLMNITYHNENIEKNVNTEDGNIISKTAYAGIDWAGIASDQAFYQNHPTLKNNFYRLIAEMSAKSVNAVGIPLFGNRFYKLLEYTYNHLLETISPWLNKFKNSIIDGADIGNVGLMMGLSMQGIDSSKKEIKKKNSTVRTLKRVIGNIGPRIIGIENKVKSLRDVSKEIVLNMDDVGGFDIQGLAGGNVDSNSIETTSDLDDIYGYNTSGLMGGNVKKYKNEQYDVQFIPISVGGSRSKTRSLKVIKYKKNTTRYLGIKNGFKIYSLGL
jgi:hypothetical protein